MFSEINNDTLACVVKSNPEFDAIIQTLIAQNKQTTSIFVHELRNPLSLLKGTLQYIETKHPEAKDYKYWNQLQDLVNDMERLMVDASLLNNYNYLSKESKDLIAFIGSIKNSFMPQAHTKQIDLALMITPGCEPYFETYSCDSIKLKQALSNLIKNAFEATSPGKFIHIILSYLPEEEPTPPKLSIEIQNNGFVIPEDELDDIFTPFVTYKKSGTGVGLAIVKRIIDLHYGSIDVASNEDTTSFTILLPV